MRRIVMLSLALAILLPALMAPLPSEAQQNICQNVNIHPNPNSLANGQVGQPYSERIWVTPNNLCIPVMWSVSPSPPFPGVPLVPGPGPEEAYLLGTPTTTGTYTFTVTAGGTWICGTICFASRTYTVTVL